MALAVIKRAGDQAHRAVGLENDFSELNAGRRGDFQIRTNRNAAELAALAAFFFPLGKIGVIGNFERLVEDALEISAVVCNSGRCRKRHLCRLDEIALAQRQPVDPHLVGGAIDQALHIVIGLRASGAAIGPHEGRIGQHGLDIDCHQGRAIDAGEVLADIERKRARRDPGDVGAEIAVSGNLDREELAFAIERQLAMNLLRPPMAVGQETGRALVSPFDGPVQDLGRMQDADVFRIVDVLHAERTPDIRRQQVNLLVRHLQDVLRKIGAVTGNALGRKLDRVALGGLVI